MRTPGKRLAGSAAALVLATTGGLLVVAGPARGDVVFTAMASADSIRIVTTMADFPATKTPVDSAGPTSIATLSSSGGGTAYSAAPDPGDFFASGPGLAAGIIGQNTPGGLPFAVPGYPLVAYADAQNPSQSIGAGGYKLDAQVGADSATATTSTGATTPGFNLTVTNSVAKITATGSKVEATGTSRTEGLTLGPLSFGLVDSRASAVSDAAGSVTKTAQFAIDGARFGNIPISLTKDGFNFAGNAVPTSGASLADSLAASGITVTYFPQTTTETGITGAGLLVTQKLPFPTFGETTITYRIGGASADLQAAGDTAEVAPAVTAPGAGTTGLPATGVDAAGAVPGAVPALGGVPAAGAPVVNQPVATVNLTSGSFPAVPDINGRGLYLALVLAGVLGAAAMALIGARGVKVR